MVTIPEPYNGVNMYDPILVEHHYNSFVRDIKSCAPDGLIKITPELIKELNIQLNYDKSEPVQSYCYFYVLESEKKNYTN